MLFKTIDEIKNFLPISIGNDFNRIKPHIENAENKFIKPLLGLNLYTDLLAFYQAVEPAEPTDAQKAMLELQQKIQFALIHLAYFVGFDFMNITVSDMGFTRQESEHTKGLYKYQEDNIRKYFTENGYNSLDDALLYIESNITHFAQFKASANWTILKSSFLPSVVSIESIPFNILGSRLIFLALKPHIAYVDDIQIKPLLGKTIYEEIKAEMVKDEPAEKVTAILPLIRKIIIYLATAALMNETGGTLDSKGLFFEEVSASYPSNNKAAPSTPETVRSRITINKLKASQYIESLKAYIANNAEDWETFVSQPASVFSRDNTDKKTFWA